TRPPRSPNPCAACTRCGAAAARSPPRSPNPSGGAAGRSDSTRLLAAIAQHPHELGVGVDENTAVVVEGHTLEVIGHGSVTIVDAGGMSFTNLNEAERHELLAICGVRIHVLPAGYRFDLQSRAPLV
ncbi:MAG TPA: hypothetical protein VD968_18005, partial [Pyrinomonadaceae bacterium]|nr:hypothetical protein [Pyrinomonadaceae bacterium]